MNRNSKPFGWIYLGLIKLTPKTIFVLLGKTLKESSISAKPLNFVGNLMSLLFFVAAGSVNYKIGLLMGAGQIIGSTIGSHIVIKNGDRIIRPVFITVTLLMTIKLLYENMPLSEMYVVLENILG